MKTQRFSMRRLTGTILLSWFAVIGFDFLLHGGLLARLYTEPSPFLLPPEDAFRLIPLGYASFLIYQIFLVWLLVRLEIKGNKSSFLLGLKVGATVWGAMVLGLLSISTAGINLMAGWWIGQTIEAGIGGMVAAMTLETTRPWRMLLYVILFVMAMIIVTVILQSTGFAPAVRIAN